MRSHGQNSSLQDLDVLTLDLAFVVFAFDKHYKISTQGLKSRSYIDLVITVGCGERLEVLRFIAHEPNRCCI